MNIRLHIDRLIVDGLPMTALQAHALRASVETQLAALLTAAPPRINGCCAVPSLQAAGISWEANADSGRLGHGIARSLHATLASDAATPTLSSPIPRTVGPIV